MIDRDRLIIIEVPGFSYLITELRDNHADSCTVIPLYREYVFRVFRYTFYKEACEVNKSSFVLVPFILVVMVCSAAAADNQVVIQARKAGIGQCLPVVETLSDFLIGTARHGADDAWATKNSDQQLYTTTIERADRQGTQLSSLSVAPVAAGGCSAVYEQVQWFDNSCLVVAQEIYGNFTYKGVLADKVAVLGGPASVYLFPAGPGCLALKKEVLINADSLNRDEKTE
jgi:hypothetical protein